MRAIFLAILVVLASALAGCGEGASRDSDGDGLTDLQETRGWTITIDFMDRRITRHVTSNPHMADTDGDGLLDVYEFALGSDPRVADTDEDGLTDCQEGRHTNRTECEDPDFEGPTDGGYRTFPANADSDPGIGRYINRPGYFKDETGTLQRPITWGDGVSDGDEVLGYEVTLPGGGIRQVKTDPLRKDSDGDGLEDGEELRYGSDPTVADTDGDGCADGFDPWPDRTHSIRLGLMQLQTSIDRDVRLFGLAQDTAWSKEVRGTIAGTSMAGSDARVSPTSCSVPPYRPWTRVEILAESDGRLLDLHSHSNPGATFAVFLNLRTGEFSWSEVGTDAFSGPLSWTGSDGSVAFHPAAVPTQGS